MFWKFLLFDLSNHSLVSPSVALPVNPDEAVFFRCEYREYGIERQRLQHIFRRLPMTIAPNHQVNNLPRFYSPPVCLRGIAANASMTYMVPMFFYEVPLGLWFLVKGVQAPTAMGVLAER
ncbi:MAG: hypothetical protein ACLPWG_14580 [Steroidobacteraceae bacterium]